MTLRHGLFVSGASAGVTAPSDARLAIASLLSGPGVLNGGVVTGSTSGPNMKYTIAAGTFITQRGTLATDGLYIVPNDGAVTVDSGSPAPVSGTRWDLIWVRQPNAYGSDGFGDPNSDPVPGVTVGTAGSTPSKPYASVPAGALVLAESNVGTGIANASLAGITQVAAKTTLLGNSQSGWQTPGLASTIVASAPAPGVYRSGNLVVVRGVITTTGGSFTATNAYAAALTFPAGSRPGATILRTAATNTATSTPRLSLNSSGAVDIQMGSTGATAIDLSCLSGYLAEN